MKRMVLLVLIIILAMLELFALFFAASVLTSNHTGSEAFSVSVAVIAPLIALIGMIVSYRRLRRLN